MGELSLSPSGNLIGYLTVGSRRMPQLLRDENFGSTHLYRDHLRDTWFRHSDPVEDLGC